MILPTGLCGEDLILVIGSHGLADFDELSDVDVRVVTARSTPPLSNNAILTEVRRRLALPEERSIEILRLTWEELAAEWRSGTFRAWAMYRCGRPLTGRTSPLAAAAPAASSWQGWFESARHVVQTYDFTGATSWPGHLSDAGFLYGLARRLTIASGGDEPEAVHMSRWGLLKPTIAPPPDISPEILDIFFAATRRIDRGLPIDPAANESIARVREALVDWILAVSDRYGLRPLTTADNHFYERLRCAERFRSMLDAFSPYMPAEYPLCTSNSEAYSRWIPYLSAWRGAEFADLAARSHALLWRKYLALPLDTGENLLLFNREVADLLKQSLGGAVDNHVVT